MKRYHFDIELHEGGGITYQQVNSPAPKGTITTEARVTELNARIFFYWVNCRTLDDMPPQWYCEGVHLSIVNQLFGEPGEMKS